MTACHCVVVRPRRLDCGSPTDFNLCANERGYSIETARYQKFFMADSDTVPNHRTDGGALRLTWEPLHTRNDETERYGHFNPLV